MSGLGRIGVIQAHVAHEASKRGKAMATRKPIRADDDAFCEFIEDYTRRHGYAPGVRDLVTPLGYTSTAPIHYRLLQLKAKGRVTWVFERARTLKVLHPEHEEVRA